MTTLRAHGLDPRRVASLTDPAASDRAVVALWAAGLSGEEIDAVARSGRVPDEAALVMLAALRRPR